MQKKIKSVAATLLKWQKDGTIDRIAKQVTNSVDKMYKVIKKVFDYVVKNKESIKENFMIAGTIYAAIKAVELFSGVLTAANLVAQVLNGTLALNPYVLAGMAIVGVSIAIYKNWEKITDIWKNATEGLMKYIDKFKEFIGLEDKGNIKTELSKEENRNINLIGNQNLGGVGMARSKNPFQFGNKGSSNNIGKSEQPTVINFYGDNYGDKDFGEKVAKVIVNGITTNKPNVTGVL